MQPMLNIALRAARSAGEMIFRSIERLDVISVDEKDAKDYVTEVDKAAELMIVQATNPNISHSMVPNLRAWVIRPPSATASISSG